MARWTWKELEVLWEHPDWTAKELHELLPTHSAQAIEKQRSRAGRWNKAKTPLCGKCEQRPVWLESTQARRYGLCKGCYIDEERMRQEDELKHMALRQQKMRLRRKHGKG